MIVTFPMGDFYQHAPRLGKPDPKESKTQMAHYVAPARKRIAVEAAANAWRNGVPWAEALQICRKAVARAAPKAKAIPRYPIPKRGARAR